VWTLSELDYSQRARIWRPEHLRDYARQIVDHLIELAQATDPKGEKQSEAGKDGKAWRALVLASELNETLVGWALNHQAGLAKKNHKHLPRRFASEVEAKPELVALRAEADAHENEITGRELAENVAPELARKILINCLRPNPAGLRSSLNQQLVTALAALEFGDTLPLFHAESLWKRVRWEELQHQLRARCLVAYRVEQGMTNKSAREQVALAYGARGDTVRGWEAALRKDLGDIEVTAALEDARAAAIIAREANAANDLKLAGIHDNRYGAQALRKAGADYRAFLKQKKARADKVSPNPA
jgi:hypothetical protein